MLPLLSSFTQKWFLWVVTVLPMMLWMRSCINQSPRHLGLPSPSSPYLSEFLASLVLLASKASLHFLISSVVQLEHLQILLMNHLCYRQGWFQDFILRVANSDILHYWWWFIEGLRINALSLTLIIHQAEDFGHFSQPLDSVYLLEAPEGSFSTLKRQIISNLHNLLWEKI